MKEMESLKSDLDQTERKDTYKLAYMIHFLLGAGNLLPWNALITAIDYFTYLYPGKHVGKVFSVAYMSSSLLVLVMMITWSDFIKNVTFRVRVNFGFTVYIFSLMVSPIMDWGWCSMEKSSVTFCVVVVCVVMCGLADGLIGGSLIGFAGKLPKEYMQAIFAGTASSGVLVSLLRIITKASLPHDPRGLRTSAHFYFIVTVVILMVCIVCCTLLYKLPCMEQHYKQLQHNNPSKTKLRDVTRMIQWPALGIFIIYTVTLSIFPGYLSENINSKLLKDWYPIILITTYNLTDFLGKSFTCFFMVKDIRMAVWGCVGRLVFYPIFTACLHGPKWFRSEVFVVFLTSMLGFTNGYLTSVIMILAPTLVPSSEAEMAAIVMALFLGMGLLCGSVLGWFWII